MTDRDALIDAVAAAIARTADSDYWTDEIAEWEVAEEWEREAHPDEYPGMAYEDREWFRDQARAALAVFERLDYYDPRRQNLISEHDCVFEDGEWWFGHGMPCKHPTLHSEEKS